MSIYFPGITDFKIISTDCNTMTWSYVGEGETFTVTSTIIYIQNDTTILSGPQEVLINNSNHPVQITTTNEGAIATFTLNPCGAVTGKSD